MLEGNIDFTMWAYIAGYNTKINGIGKNFGDVFSNIFGFIMALSLIAAPIYMLYVALQL